MKPTVLGYQGKQLHKVTPMTLLYAYDNNLVSVEGKRWIEDNLDVVYKKPDAIQPVSPRDFGEGMFSQPI